MIVECIHSKGYLVVGRKYVVIEIHAASRGVQYRLYDPFEDDGTPPLGEASSYRILSPRIPPTWECAFEGDTLTLAPRAWLRDGFWEDYFGDTTPAIVAEYRDTLAELLTFESVESLNPKF